MAVLKLNAELVARLSTESVTLMVNEKGKPVGYFTPIDPAIPQISDAEMLRRARSPEKGVTTAELLALLEKR